MKIRRILIVIIVAIFFLTFNSCNPFEKDQNTNVYLKLKSLTGLSAGTDPGGVSEMGTAIIYSDVVHDIAETSGRYWSSDYAVAELEMAFVNPDIDVENYPTDYTEVIVHRVDVEFLRPDGNNVPGVTVPESFSLSVHGRLNNGLTLWMPFPVFTQREKKDEPLVDLYYTGEIQLTVKCTFYSRDYRGNEIKHEVGEITAICSNYADSVARTKPDGF